MDVKKTALDILSVALKAADPYHCIKKYVRIEHGSIVIDGITYPSVEYPKVMVVGAGKASARMAQALEDVLGDRINGGWINTKDDHAVPVQYIHVHECGHPVPDERGLTGARHIREILTEADDHTLVIGLLSGGGSALMPAPVDGITLKEKQDITSLLLKSGAAINELNAIRKHLSTLKGGGMARLAYPARLHMLILSDVIGDKLDVIASGPGVSDSSTFQDCLDICERYNIMDSLPENVKSRFIDGSQGKIPDTLKEGDTVVLSAVNSLIGNNRMSVEAARSYAGKLGYNTLVLSTMIEGEASDVGTVLSSVALEIMETGNPIKKPACVICGGETTVTIRGKGKGGRNQEMSLKVAQRLRGIENFMFLSAGTDGTDGPTDAAGGIVDGNTVLQGEEKGFDCYRFLDNNDSYHYLEAVDGLIKTGPTGTNVMDIQILLVGRP
ncbi:MAG: glycerate kinase [Candidatus Latescibacteria bacterium]|nr:glycerate kinase [Candidatus Latescibacterota bacterium]